MRCIHKNFWVKTNLLKWTLGIFVTAHLLSSPVFPQTKTDSVRSINISDFAPVLSFLSSAWMEGREAGTNGSLVAADYIASMMQLNGLLPYGDFKPVSNPDFKNGKPQSRSYFQEFKMVKYSVESAALNLATRADNSAVFSPLDPFRDFDVDCGLSGLDGKGPVVFAGYGISMPDKGYDDYYAIDVKGTVVIVLMGYPGKNDTTSLAWKKLGKPFENGNGDIEHKRKTAQEKGAIAIIEIKTDSSFRNENYQEKRIDASDSLKSDKNNYPEYTDDLYSLSEPFENSSIPLFRAGLMAGKKLIERAGINIDQVEELAGSLLSSSVALPDEQINFSIKVNRHSIKGINVLGIIYGEDTTKNVILGAHYDHLGIRENSIYYGADDNASGVAGMLAIAESFTESRTKPGCNIIFASWTAEEKGMLGSKYFVHQYHPGPKTLDLAINLDMISRSSPDDSAQKILSVGTLPGSGFKESVKRNNLLLTNPFILDLWDASAGGGSDYAPFAEKNIPVMTFFSGFHDDYHTPEDTYNHVDLNKMKSVLELVNKCLFEVCKQQ